MQVIPYFCHVKKKKGGLRSGCPISTALDIFGDKWSLLIIRDLMFNEKSTFGGFLHSEEKIATNILADRLVTLERGEIISRQDHPESKLKVLYKLTPKGLDLIPMMVEIIAWSEKHHDVHPYAKQFAKQIKKDKDSVIKGVRDGLKKS